LQPLDVERKKEEDMNPRERIRHKVELEREERRKQTCLKRVLDWMSADVTKP
jgi:hypothetical protein